MKKLVLAVALVVAFAAPAMAQDFPQGYNQNSINFDQVISPCWAPACRRVSPPTIIDGIMVPRRPLPIAPSAAIDA